MADIKNTTETPMMADPLLAAGVYTNVCDKKPVNGNCYIVCDPIGQNYHIAFWSDELMDFVNQTGKLNESFVMYTPLPIYACR